MKRVVRVLEIVSEFSGHAMGWLVFALMAMVLIEVVTRYVLQSPLAIADEMGGYMLVAITFIGLGYTWKERGHVRVEFLVNTLPEKSRRWLRLLTDAIATAFAGVLVYASWMFVSYTSMFGTRSGSWLRIPMKWPQMVLIVGSVLLLVQLLADLVKTASAVRGTEGRS